MVVPDSLRPSPKIAYPAYSEGTLNIEEYFYQYFNKTPNSELRTPNFTYVPAFWTHYYIQHDFGRDAMPEHDQLMRELITSNKKFFTITQYDDGILGNVPPNLTVFSAGNPGTKQHPFIPIPLLADGFPAGGCHGEPAEPRAQADRKNLICFAGSLETHPLRQKMADYFKGKPGVVFAEGLPPKEYAALMQDSIYTLCPRGYGISSFRTYEAMKCGSIPLYFVGDNEPWHVPYEPWGNCIPEKSMKDLMLFFDESDFKELRGMEHCPDIYTWLGAITRTGGAQAAFKRICNSRKLLTMHHTCEYILQWLNAHK